MAEERNWLSVYNYVQNNPMLRTDPTGGLDTIPRGRAYVASVEVDGLQVVEYDAPTYDPIMPAPEIGMIPLIPIPLTNATLIISDAIQIADVVSDVAAPGKGLLKGGLKKLGKKLKGFIKKFAHKKPKQSTGSKKRLNNKHTKKRAGESTNGNKKNQSRGNKNKKYNKPPNPNKKKKN